MANRLGLLICIFLLSCLVGCQYLVFPRSPGQPDLIQGSKIKVHVSPLGFKPRTGILHGALRLADPLSACSEVQSLDVSNEEDTFLLADDSTCLESVKARNLANSGAYIGIIKRNINNTFHDREVDLVHIPILEVEPAHYETLVAYLTQHPEESVAVQADFSQDSTAQRRINMELWFSPTEDPAYKFIADMSSFVMNQQDKVSFMPRFVLHSQAAQKQYVGCFSRGRFCPPEIQFEGKPEGTNIVSQSLRQIIITKSSVGDWFRYALCFHRKCLLGQPDSLWKDQNSVLCSENCMRSQGLDAPSVFTAYNQSFSGSRPEVDGNIYLEEERQGYISEKITHYPVVLINGKSYPINGDLGAMKLKICNMIDPDPSLQTPECQKITKPSLFSTGELLVGLGVLLAAMVGVMFIYKVVVHRKMKLEMRGEVDKTLSQYYRYMETLEEPDIPTGKQPLMEEKIETNQIGSVELNDIKEPTK